jgi:hypothetical protein
MRIGFKGESQSERNHWDDLDVGGRLVLKWILETQDRVVLAELIRLRIGTSSGLL